jgi:hypothetical protein
MPLGLSTPIAVLATASLMAGGASATPTPHEPPAKPKPAVTTAPAVPATATATAAPAATTTAAATATAAGGAAAAAGGATGTATGGFVPRVPAGLSTGSLDSRLAALTKLIAERKTTVDARRQKEQDETRTRWGALVDQPAIAAELKTHAERTARLGRIEELAEVEAKPAIASRAARALYAENSRHEKQMQALAGGAK